MSHTPGPWHHSGDGEVFAQGERKVIANGLMVYDFLTEEGDLTACANYKANARLIAAAPELLAVVERLAGGNPNVFCVEHEEWQQLCADAKAAIAKAKGGIE